MNADLRRRLREAVSAARKAELDALRAWEASQGWRCSGCGVLKDDFTVGCRRCHARAYDAVRRERRYGKPAEWLDLREAEAFLERNRLESRAILERLGRNVRARA